jgi:hypothetical protein
MSRKIDFGEQPAHLLQFPAGIGLAGSPRCAKFQRTKVKAPRLIAGGLRTTANGQPNP